MFIAIISKFKTVTVSVVNKNYFTPLALKSVVTVAVAIYLNIRRFNGGGGGHRSRFKTSTAIIRNKESLFAECKGWRGNKKEKIPVHWDFRRRQ